MDSAVCRCALHDAAFRSSGGADVFVTKLNNNGTAIVYSTYLGGSADDSGNAIAIDAGGGIYVAGSVQQGHGPSQ